MGLTFPLVNIATARDPYQLSSPVPGSIDELEQVTGKDFVTKDGEIFDYFEDTQCGGWDKDESVEGKIAKISEVESGDGTSATAPESSEDMPEPPETPKGGIPLKKLPKMLGYPLAPLEGLPGRKGAWSGNIPSGMAARDDNNFKYPHGAEGYSFAYDVQNPWCTWLPEAFFDIPQTFCSTEKSCLKTSDIINNEWRYPVCRITECWAGMYVYAVYVGPVPEGQDPPEPWGPHLWSWDVYNTDSEETTPTGEVVHTLAECNSCPVLPGQIFGGETFDPVDFTCPEWPDWISVCWMGQALPKVGGHVGEKFICTADANETFTPAIWTATWYDDADPPNSYEYTAVCPNADGDAATNARALLVPHGWVWLDEAHSGIDLPVQCEQYWIKENTEYPNVTTCGVEDHIDLVGAAKYTKDDSTPGKECRCPIEGCFATERMSPKNGAPYISFFRRYKGKFTRDPLPVPPIVRTNSSASSAVSEITEKEGEVACYGWYQEFDPLKQMPDTSDWRCVIDIFGEDKDETLREQMRKSHALRGEYGQNSSFLDRDPSLDPHQRFGGDPLARGAFDEDEDPWYLKLGGGFSFINEKVFDKKFDKDLSLALLKPDTAEMRMEHLQQSSSSAQPEKYVRAFDDAVTNATGDLRPIVRWWQGEETKANTLFSPPTIRLLLPSTWAVSIDPLDPLFTPKRVPSGNPLTRTDALEVQLRAHEDLMGEVAAYIERSILLNIEQEPVPVIVPMGSPTELRAIAESWCTWWIGYSNRSIPDAQAASRISTCDGAPSNVLALIQKLEIYADRIEDVRGLRGELAYYLTRVLEAQLDIVLPIAQWLQQNLTTYQDFFNRRQQIFDELLPIWQFTQYIYQQFHDAMNFPWCMNQRFTIPIYSLIDPFIPVRENRTGRVNGLLDYSCPSGGSVEWPFCMPILHGIQTSTDYVFDFSMLNITASGTIQIPVLDPIQIKLDVQKLRPPSIETLPGTVPTLADLPSIPDIQTIMRQALTNVPLHNVQVVSTPSVILPPPLITDGTSIQNIERELLQIFYMVYVMTYGTEEGTGGFPGYEDFWSSLVHMEDEETGEVYFWCPAWTGWPCVHVEMDLLERFTRIGARPAVLLSEDYDSHGEPRESSFTCPPDDHVCLFLNTQTRFPKEGWKVNAPTVQQDFIDAVRANMRGINLPQPIGGGASSAMPPYEAKPSDLLDSIKIVPGVYLRPTLPSLPIPVTP